MSGNELYNELISITSNCVGENARRVVDQQIENHLKKSPKRFSKKDLDKIDDWMVAAVALMTEDKEAVSTYRAKIKALS